MVLVNSDFETPDSSGLVAIGIGSETDELDGTLKVGASSRCKVVIGSVLLCFDNIISSS